jgi:hypothetical protein
VNNTFRIFPTLVYCGVYNKTAFVHATVCTPRIYSVSFAVNLHQTRSSNLVVKQSIGIDQKILALPALSRTPELENQVHFLVSYFRFLHRHLDVIALKHLKI